MAPLTEPAARDPWPAPLATGPVRGTVAVPGSKSATNRALVCAALARGTSALTAPLQARDTQLMAAGLRALGVAIDTGGPEGAAVWRVTGNPDGLIAPREAIDVGLAGTVARFLPPVAALAAGTTRFDGDPRIRERPMAPLVTAMRGLGIEVDAAGSGALPLAVTGTGSPPDGGPVALDATSSSQFISALLLAGPSFRQGVSVTHNGTGPAPSRAHLRMTTAMLGAFGATVGDGPSHWSVAPGGLRATDLHIEPDLSNAAPFLAAALVTGGEVTVPGWPADTTQPATLILEVLEHFGASWQIGPDGLVLSASGVLHGIDVDLRDWGEGTPTVAALCALADSPSQLRGVAHIRLHETDRLTALATEINALGGAVEELPDGLAIRPAALHGGVFRTYHDHRMATAAAILGLRVPGVLVRDVATTAKTLPGFDRLWARLVGVDARTPAH